MSSRDQCDPLCRRRPWQERENRDLTCLDLLPFFHPGLSGKEGKNRNMSANRVEELERRHAAAEQGGGRERRERQHREGKLSARERIELLLDDGTFEELDKLVRH